MRRHFPATRVHFAFLAVLLTAPAWGQQAPEGETAAPPPAPVPEVREADALDQLQAAYQKEYAFLEAQLRDLRQRSEAFETESSRAEVAREAEIERTEGEWINLQSRAERLQNLLTEAQREIEAVDDARTTLEATLLQAGSTLESAGIDTMTTEAYGAADDGRKIEMAFDEALDLVQRSSSVRTVQGAYFLPDGSEVTGDILRVGNVAAYGLAPEGGGALAPAGEGEFKVWSEPAEDTARALAQGRSPEALGIFLFESESKAIEERADKTLLSVIESGGTIAWIIVALGLLGLVLILARLVFLRSASASTDKIVNTVGDLVREGKIEDALAACRRFKGSTARVVAAAVRNLDRDREHLEDIVSESILHESTYLNRFGSFILVIAAVAPLLGLLGTVTGMITTFDVITEFGTGDPKLLSGGISIALVTTEVGLAVAIPTLLLGNLLSSWANGIKDDMQKGALRVINRYKERFPTPEAIPAAA